MCHVASPPDLSLVLACYNEESILESSVDEILQVLDTLDLKSEVIFVDDASQDQTSGIIDRILQSNPERSFSKLTHAYNVGRGGTVADGFRTARGRFVGFIDVDLEIRPQCIRSCALALQQGYDAATAKRIYKAQLRSVHRQVMSRGYNGLMKWWLDVPLTDTEAGCKFFRREKILPILDRVVDQRWFWDTEIMVHAHAAGLRMIELPANFERRADKASSVKIMRDSLRHFGNLIRFGRVISELKRGPPR